MIRKIQNKIKKIDYVIHIADIHIRLQKRHDEYLEVFNELYTYCKNFVSKNPNTIIFVGGDIAHSKTDMSPEQIDMIQGFFESLAVITETIIILGNHDCNLNNKSRLDAITPIVNALNLDNLYYFKYTGIYEFGNVYFNLMSVADRPSNYITADKIPNDKIKIALHHGAVNGSKTAVGFELVNDSVNLKTFEGHDITMLGDIHLLQYLNAEKTIAYCSSLIQQDFSEDLDNHGLLLWNLNTKTSEFIKIHNNYGFVTMDVENGVIEDYTGSMPNFPKIRLRTKSTPASRLKEIITDLKIRYNVNDVVLQRIKEKHKETQKSTVSLGNVRDIEYQNTLIADYLQNRMNIIDDSIIDGVRHVNRAINSKNKIKSSIKNVTYNLLKFEFSNMFSYGENNIIDFGQMSGIYGLFAANRSGKSSLLDSVLYCIFDKCTKTNRAIHVLNNKSNNFKCKLEIDINGQIFFIERYGNKTKSGTVKVMVDFYTFDEFGEKKSLNGEERDETNNIIRSYLGTYDDFMLTSVIAQNNNTGFIEMKQADRKDLLLQFMDINVFDDLLTIASNEIKDISALIKNMKKTDYESVIANSTRDIELLEGQYKEYINKRGEFENVVTTIEEGILELTSNIIKIDKNYDINSLNLTLERLKSQLTAISNSYNSDLEKLKTINEQIQQQTDVCNSFDLEQLKNSLDQLKQYKIDKNKVDSDIRVKRQEIQNMNSKMQKLRELEYDPDCKFCMGNVFVKDAIQTKDTIEVEKKSLEELQIKQANLDLQINSLIKDETIFNDYNLQNNKLNSLKLELSNLNLLVEKNKLNGQRINSEYKEVINDIAEYEKNKDSIISNNEINKKIELLREKSKDAKQNLSSLNDLINRTNANIQVKNVQKQNALDEIEKLKKLEDEFKYYELYLAATNRNGVPYDLLCKVIPYIESEINNILSQLVDFSIKLETDDKNINAFIVYDEDNFWPIELVSGMEKFISSLAIRSSLVNITNLPKPNFIAIDEGFTQLDAENLSSMHLLFSYLKTQFDFIMLISHIDVMRDMVDHFIDIKKDNLYSKVELY